MDKYYICKYIKRKNKIRKIVTYRDGAQEIREYHEAVVRFLNENTYNSIFAKAYIPKSSIYKNASAHMYNDFFVKLDIKHFFQNIDLKILEKQLYKEINKRTEISLVECHNIVKKCSLHSKGLPLGLVSSPALANLYLKEFDGIVYGKIKKLNLSNPIYTRYADDIVVSFRRSEEYQENETEKAILSIISEMLSHYHLALNEQKTQIINLETSNHCRITGVSIVKKPDGTRRLSVGRKTKNDIFWRAINLYDSENKDYHELNRLKGLLSFVLSIEKKGIESTYSEKMMELLHKRNANTVRELLDRV